MTKKNINAGHLALKRPSLSLRTDDIIGQSNFLNPKSHSGAAAVMQDDILVGILTERDLLKRVLAKGFDLNETLVKDVMSPNPAIIPANASLKDTLDIITQSGFRYLPVMDQSTFIGMVDIRDLYVEVQNLLEETLCDERTLFANIMSEPYGVDTYGASKRSIWY